MVDRKPATDHFDAVCRFANNETTGPYGFAVVKHNLGWSSGQPRFLEAEPLEGDPSEENRDPRIPPFSDFWPFKARTDVIVCGHAYAPGGQPAESFECSIRVGDRLKRVKVFGPRVLRFVNGEAVVGPPDPVLQVPVGREEAYGGTDELVHVDAEPGSEAELALNFDHPGLYPRNEAGRGYVVMPEDGREVDLPSLESPDDPLTARRIVAAGPHLWHRQPLPWYLGRSSLLDFPRMAYLGVNPWFLGPEDEQMPEVRRGDLPPNYRSVIDAHLDETGRDIRMRQAASYDLTFPRLSPGTPVELRGLHPDKSQMTFRLPSYVPRMEFIMGKEIVPAEPHLHHVVIHPEEERFTMVYGAVAELRGTWIPRIHKTIPLSVLVDGQHRIDHETPEAVADMMGAPEV